MVAAGDRPAVGGDPVAARRDDGVDRGREDVGDLGARARPARDRQTDEVLALARTLYMGPHNTQRRLRRNGPQTPMKDAEIDGWLALSGAVMSVGRDDALAEALFALARTHAPREDVARYATLELAKLRLKSGRFHDASAQMASFVPGDETERHIATLIRAETMYALSDYASAAADYQAVLRAGVIKTDRLVLALAWATLRAGDPLTAGRQFLAFAGSYPKDPEADAAIARAHASPSSTTPRARCSRTSSRCRASDPKPLPCCSRRPRTGIRVRSITSRRRTRAGTCRARFRRGRALVPPRFEQGQAEAQLALASLFEIGLGLPRDDGEAVKWYRRAAAQGVPPRSSSSGSATTPAAGS